MKQLYLDLVEVTTTTTLGEATIQRMVREGEFPPPRQISRKRTAWLAREVEEWAEGRPVSNLPPPPNTGHRRAKREEARAL